MGRTAEMLQEIIIFFKKTTEGTQLI